MASAVTGRNPEFGPEDYEAIERAVMETPRGRWFLGERDKRQRTAEIHRILEALKKLEAVLAALPAQPAPMSGQNPDSGANGYDAAALAASLGTTASAETATQALALKNKKYFKQDEAIFVPAATAPAVKMGARLIVQRGSPSGAGIAADPDTPAAAAAPPATEARPPGPETAPAPEPAMAQTGDKRRIVIIRRAATDSMEVPLQAELAASPVP
jgi:hypothetical protein